MYRFTILVTIICHFIPQITQSVGKNNDNRVSLDSLPSFIPAKSNQTLNAFATISNYIKRVRSKPLLPKEVISLKNLILHSINNIQDQQNESVLKRLAFPFLRRLKQGIPLINDIIQYLRRITF